MIYLTDKIPSRSGATIAITIKDEDGNSVDASYLSSMTWSLYDADDVVINSREDVAVEEIENPVNISLEAGDTDNEDGTKRKLVLSFEVDTEYGTDIDSNQTVIFEIESATDEADILDVENNILTLSRLKNYLEIDSDDTDSDSELENLINAVSWFCNTYTNRLLKFRQNITEYFDGDGGSKIFIENPPIVSTVSEINVYLDDSIPRDFSDAVDSSYLVIDAEKGRINLLDDIMPNGPQTVKVVYDGGYTVIPYDLERAALELAREIWMKQKDKIASIVTMNMQGGSVNIDVNRSMNPFTKAVLDKYARRLDF
jgi:hypothetical protein